MDRPTVGMVVCIEDNKIAAQALMLIASIREFGGDLSDARIYCFNPRGLGPLRRQHRDQLSALDVVYSEDTLNTAYRDYALANKPIVAARAEAIATEDILVFIDSDSVILNEPSCFRLNPDLSAAVTPVWTSGIGSRGPGDPAHLFWRIALEACGIVCELPYVHTRLTQIRICLYFNSGLIVARRSAGIFREWNRCFRVLKENSRVQGVLHSDVPGAAGIEPAFFLEQASLALALAPIFPKMALLDERYNCPLHQRAILKRAYPQQVFDLDRIVHFHYNLSFHMEGFLESLQPPFNPESRQYQWLQGRLPLQPVMPLIDQSKVIPALELDMERWRGSLRRSLAYP